MLVLSKGAGTGTKGGTITTWKVRQYVWYRGLGSSVSRSLLLMSNPPFSMLVLWRRPLSQDPVRATSSRFISQSGLACYKFILSIYFVFWCFYWPIEENIDDGFKFVTYWTFYVGAFCECPVSWSKRPRGIRGIPYCIHRIVVVQAVTPVWVHPAFRNSWRLHHRCKMCDTREKILAARATWNWPRSTFTALLLL